MNKEEQKKLLADVKDDLNKILIKMKDVGAVEFNEDRNDTYDPRLEGILNVLVKYFKYDHVIPLEQTPKV